jgi:DNA-binding IclR family transcriptional regulator
MVQDWLEAHDATIDINAFAKNFKMSTTRVEQILNSMVSLGYIELKG